MTLIVKEICKKQNIKLKDLAEKMGIARESLTRVLAPKGNPTLSTLKNISEALGVEVWELFAKSNESTFELNGFIEYNGNIYKIQSRQDLEHLLKQLK